MPKRRSTFHRTLGELKRRHVIRTMGAYAVSVWLVLQVADVVLPAVAAPPWVMTALIVAVMLGAPLTAVLAWFYDLTPEGILRTGTAGDDGEVVPALGGRGIDYAIIAGLVVILCFVWLRPAPEPAPIGNRIAVLPFESIGAEAADNYVADGIAEAIIDQLARIPGIRVSARTSSFSFRDSELSGPEIARRLNVDTLLEGSVRRSGERLRISARLIDGNGHTQLWSDTFSGSMGQGFELQDKIASAVAQVMRVQLTTETSDPLDTSNPEAYDRYLMGRAELRENPGRGLASAIDHFEVALRLDPDFGLAAAGLCRASWERYEYTREPALAEQAMTRCENAAQRYPQLAETRIGTGSLLLGTGEPEQAEAEFRVALEREPHNAEALAGLSVALMDQRRFMPALAAAEDAIRADPAYWRPRWELGVLFYRAGRLAEAEDATRAAIRLNRSSPDPWILLGAIHHARGDFLKAADAFEQSLSQEPTPIAYSNAATLNYYLGQYGRAEELLKRALEMNPKDFRYSAALAWTIEAQEGRKPEARPHHNAVIDSATNRLAINHNDFAARAALAVHLAALGHETAARGAMTSLPPMQEMDPDTLARTAISHYLLGNTADSAATFAYAVQTGLPPFYVERDPRLQQAWELPEFRALAESIIPPESPGQGEQP